jgi:hypothetical protein
MVKPLCIIKMSGAMGDILLTEPFTRYVAQNFRICYQTHQRFVQVLENSPFIEKIITLDDAIPSDAIGIYNLDGSYVPHLDVPIHEAYFKAFGFDLLADMQYHIYFKENETYGLPKNCVVVDMSSIEGRQYYNNWQPLLDYIHNCGYKIVLIGNYYYNDPRQLNNIYLDLRKTSTSIRELYCIINECEYYIGVESGPLHIAKTLGKKGIGIYCAYWKITSTAFPNTQIMTYRCNCCEGLPTVCYMKCKKSEFDVNTIMMYFDVFLGNTFYSSQARQDDFVLKCLDYKRNGTFLEIGSASPIMWNNSFSLEKKYNWRGIMVEIDWGYLESYKTVRPNSYHIIGDASTVDYKTALNNANMPKNIDYLQIDLEVENMSTLNCLYNLDKHVFDEYKFAVVTFEHDFYRGDFFDTRNISRQIFEKRGYKRIFSDVQIKGLAFEDWYIHPDLVAKSIPCNDLSIDCNEVIAKL